MATARERHVSLEATPYYHCISRCVRRAFLCGYDKSTGRNFEHRRAWIETKILDLQNYFCIDVCAYAVMNNHYHVVLHVDEDLAKKQTDREVVERWQGMFKGTLLTQQFLLGGDLSKVEIDAVQIRVEEWRKRLMDISWFIRCVNEGLAREANREDSCTGRFWEGRFKSQALLDEKALVACMAYVDLNPLRAKMCKTPEASKHTSIKRRCEKAQQTAKRSHNPELPKQQVHNLMPFAGNPRKNSPKGLSFKLRDYIELVDWTGRQIRSGKRGSVDLTLPPILARLNIEIDNWMVVSCHFESRFKGLVGAKECLTRACERFHLSRVVGLGSSRLLG